MLYKKVIFLFGGLTLLNIAVFLFRDIFQYIPYAEYNELYRPCNQACCEKWKQFVLPYKKEELQAANQILHANKVINDSLTTKQKALSIAAFLYNNFCKQVGMPSGVLNNCSPLQVYQKLTQQRSEKLWCGHFALMFEFFCWSANIPCRYIEVLNPGNHHVLNECYLYESKQWVMMDLLGNILLPYTDSMHYNNVQDFRDAVLQNKQQYSWSSQNNHIERRNVNNHIAHINTYYKPENSYLYHYYISLDRVYRPANKLKRYLLPVSWYEIYNKQKGLNILFYTKLLLFIAWLLSLVMLIILTFAIK